MTTTGSFEVRRMNLGELDLAVEWAAQEGWNPGLADAGSFYAADPLGFFIAVENGQPIGSISAVAYDRQFGFIGFFIVKPPFRGHRVGIELGKMALGYLGSRNIGVDGVEAKIKNYEAIGFKLAYNNIRYEGLCPAGGAAEETVPVSALPFAQVEAYDRRFFPAPRSTFLDAWVHQPKATALAVAPGGVLRGYGMIRPCRKGFKIGPLFAGDAQTAEQLLDALTARAPEGAPFYLDTPGINPAAVSLAERKGMKPVFKTARMYNREIPALPMHEIFGVTSFELG